MRNEWSFMIFLALLVWSAGANANAGVRIKDLGRIDGVRDNMIVGYGIVTGLAGTGDSARSKATMQSVANALKEFGVHVTIDQLSTRNVATVMVSATLPAFARPGDKLDAAVSSIGDARSLTGGTLLLAPLYGPDHKIYALAQGVMATSSFSYQLFGNLQEKNHPTAGVISEGAVVEANVPTKIVHDDDAIRVVLFNPDYTTANRIAAGINQEFGNSSANALDAGRVEVHLPTGASSRLVEFVARLENVSVAPDQRARVIVNEKTGTVVSGGDATLSKVSIAYGDLRVSIVTDYLVSQPTGGYWPLQGTAGRTVTVPQTQIDVKESPVTSVSLPDGATISDLVASLNRIKTSTRDIIAVLQSIKRAGAMHAELIIQ
jgi:flagellar P-ring protein precursor FlgI